MCAMYFPLGWLGSGQKDGISGDPWKMELASEKNVGFVLNTALCMERAELRLEGECPQC